MRIILLILIKYAGENCIRNCNIFYKNFRTISFEWQLKGAVVIIPYEAITSYASSYTGEI